METNDDYRSKGGKHFEIPNTDQKILKKSVSVFNDGNKLQCVSLNDKDNDGKSTEKRKSKHLETYMKIHYINFFFGWIVGLGVCHTWKYNNGTRWTKIMLTFGTGIAIYSHLMVLPDTSKLIEVFSLFGIIIPAVLKYNKFLNTWKTAIALNDFLIQVFERNTEGRKAELLNVHINGCLISVRVFILAQTLALCFFLCYPIYGYIVNNELISIMPMRFPFIDQTTYVGFIVANLLMMKMGVWAYTGLMGFDLFIARFIYNYTALVKLLKQDLIEYAEICKKTSNYSVHYRKAFFRNILIKCQDKDRFIQVINDTFADIIFQQFGVVYICLTFALYAIIRNSWYSGYGFCLFCLFELYILCFLGTAIKSENDKFCAAIYELPWYEFSVSNQKEVLLLLHSSQNAMELWIGPLAPLNVETGYEITKSIYSTSTMIINTAV